LQKTAIKAHSRSYDDPITLNAGERVTIAKRDMWDDEHLWLWGISKSGKQGWIPATILCVDGDTGIVEQDYSASELSIAVGEAVTIHHENSGWYWCENAVGERGWIPVSCFSSD
jgi:uncharacterized protein YgiM (DUF1202 family)